MARDPRLDALLADIADAMPEFGDSVTLLAGAESCQALYDDGEVIGSDASGREVQSMETVVRYREDAITRPAVNDAVTVRWPADDRTDESFLVREARRDPGNPGMIRVALTRT
jgi:hypothetical protein